MEHFPVMYAESLRALNIRADGAYLDCTFGRGGHSKGILEKLNDKGTLLAFDKDLAAITSSYAKTIELDQRFTLQHSSFIELKTQVKQQCDGLIDGILIDLGVSSPQLDDAQRGFSFLKEGPLDMRMDTNASVSAATWLETVSEATLTKVLFEYGEERFARRIAQAIIIERQNNPLISTRQLAHIISEATPVKDKHKHPATRSFQAIRIAVNEELDELKSVLGQAASVLKPGGRLVVISFHSLEDRIVKRFIRDQSSAPYNPSKLPIKEVDLFHVTLKKVGKIMRAGDDEVKKNPRARSAIMRIAEKL
ncbi:MAG: 16S rRNA (cytosine(1402)-N(4))-methyltransferase RsmH [Methylococcales bacterium]|nr:16S rRNA (cytosine(1402)-N(4))-methyltransferase RsmH [Methylococcales bacterium]MCK5926398.1 16S rRNA (cytosine(1402)-N(4))-methyltransferase RsmH [Methylococcales bacterium]